VYYKYEASVSSSDQLNSFSSTTRMEGYGVPSPHAPVSSQSSHGYHEIAKVALLVIFKMVIILFFKKLANYFMRNQQVDAQTAGSAIVQPTRLPQRTPKRSIWSFRTSSSYATDRQSNRIQY
jgi:hypothetical protein